MNHNFTLSILQFLQILSGYSKAASTVFCPVRQNPYTESGVRIYLERIKIVCLPFALLVCNGARSLAGRLARSLTLTAAALSSRFLQICLIDGLDVLHNKNPPYQTYLQFCTCFSP